MRRGTARDRAWRVVGRRQAEALGGSGGGAATGVAGFRAMKPTSRRGAAIFSEVGAKVGGLCPGVTRNSLAGSAMWGLIGNFWDPVNNTV